MATFQDHRDAYLATDTDQKTKTQARIDAENAEKEAITRATTERTDFVTAIQAAPGQEVLDASTTPPTIWFVGPDSRPATRNIALMTDQVPVPAPAAGPVPPPAP